MATAEKPKERDYEALLDAYAAEKRRDPDLARQRRAWVMLGEQGKMRVSEGTLEERVSRLDTQSR